MLFMQYLWHEENVKLITKVRFVHFCFSQQKSQPKSLTFIQMQKETNKQISLAASEFITSSTFNIT